MQTAIVLIIVLCAVIYSARRVYNAITRPYDPCRDCDGCKIKEQMRSKRTDSCGKANRTKTGRQSSTAPETPRSHKAASANVKKNC